MKSSEIEIEWPNGSSSVVKVGDDWITVALEAGVKIPTGCLGGSCGACEIEVNGKIIRACINNVSSSESSNLKVTLASDPYW